jgi:hypothetical protein
MSYETREQNISTADFVKVGDRDRSESAEVPVNVVTDGPAAHPEDEPSAPLFAADEGQRFRSQWAEIQTGFVDEPRKSVEEADHLVAAAIQRLAKIFADERAKLEHEWSRGEDKVSTEDLRVALRRYRSFFDRLLSV